VSKWVLEYSKEQDQYHLHTSTEHTKYPTNGYKMMGVFDTENDAFNFLLEAVKPRGKISVEAIQNILALNLSARNDGTMEKAARAVVEYVNREESCVKDKTSNDKR